MPRLRICALGACLSLIACVAASRVSAAEPPRQLALLIAAPEGDEVAELNDVNALHAVLRRRGFEPEQIMVLREEVSRARLLDFLRGGARRVADWPDGSIFLAYSGHGTYEGADAKKARPGLMLGKEKLFWDEVFSALRLPRKVRVTLLPDC